MNLHVLLEYLMPPLVGAFIGYMTNYIAIRMLFRPLKAWRVFGTRVPMTPGVIPARRQELAAKLGRTVGRHLMTPEDVGRALEKPVFQEDLRQVVGNKIDQFLDSEHGTVDSLLPPGRRTWLVNGLRLANDAVTEAVFEYLAGDDFAQRFHAALRHKSEEWLARDLGELVPPEKSADVQHRVQHRIRDLLQSDRAADAVKTGIDDKFEQACRSDKTLRELLPEDAPNLFHSLIDDEVPPMLAKLGGMLDDPEVRDRLTARLESVVREFLKSLSGFSGLLARFVDTDQLYTRIPEFLNQAEEEIADWLNEDRTQAQAADLLKERADAFLDQPLSSVLHKLPFEKLDGTKRFIQDETLRFLRSESAATLTMAALERGWNQVRRRPLRSLLNQVLPDDGVEETRKRFADALLAALQSETSRRAFRQILDERTSTWIFERRLGKPGERIPDDLRDQLPELVHQQLLDILRREFPSLMNTLNVERLVEENVNSLSIQEVEGLLLDIMRRHFAYINCFGGVLGFVIGCLNILW